MKGIRVSIFETSAFLCRFAGQGSFSDFLVTSIPDFNELELYVAAMAMMDGAWQQWILRGRSLEALKNGENLASVGFPC